MTTLSTKCIYSLKNIPDTTFQSQEHVFPACIGGKKKLPAGYVSDEVNALFSKLELNFARNTDIALQRAFYGPGKRGSLAPQDATKSEIQIILHEGDRRIGLGYIKLSKPHAIDSVLFRKDTQALCFSLQPQDGVMREHLMDSFHKQLQSFCASNPIIFLPTDRLGELEYCLGFHKGKQYVAHAKTANRSAVISEVAAFVSAAITQLPGAEKSFSSHSESSSANPPQTVFDFAPQFNPNDYYRVLAKIAFNCLAHLKERYFVLQHAFDPIREAIYKGTDVMCFFSQHDNSQGSFGDIFKSLEANLDQKILNDKCHWILFSSSEKRLLCALGLYGFDQPHIFTLAENVDSDVSAAFICNWQTGIEKDLIIESQRLGVLS